MLGLVRVRDLLSAVQQVEVDVLQPVEGVLAGALSDGIGLVTGQEARILVADSLCHGVRRGGAPLHPSASAERVGLVQVLHDHYVPAWLLENGTIGFLDRV